MHCRTKVGDLTCLSSYVPFLKLALCIASQMCSRKANLNDFSAKHTMCFVFISEAFIVPVAKNAI